MCSPGHKGHDDLTSSPPSSHLTAAVRPESPTLLAGNWTRGLRSLRDLTQHLTTRADDSHAAPCIRSLLTINFHLYSSHILAQVRFLAYRRIKPHAPPLVRTPVNSFEFHRCRRTPQVVYLSLSLRHSKSKSGTASKHRLGRGLPGYLILFAPHAFVPQRQIRSSKLPSQSVFYDISMHFTATCHIPPTSTCFKSDSINSNCMG